VKAKWLSRNFRKHQGSTIPTQIKVDSRKTSSLNILDDKGNRCRVAEWMHTISRVDNA